MNEISSYSSFSALVYTFHYLISPINCFHYEALIGLKYIVEHNISLSPVEVKRPFPTEIWQLSILRLNMKVRRNSGKFSIIYILHNVIIQVHFPDLFGSFTIDCILGGRFSLNSRRGFLLPESELLLRRPWTLCRITTLSTDRSILVMESATVPIVQFTSSIRRLFLSSAW
jgi:hypothetical protein